MSGGILPRRRRSRLRGLAAMSAVAALLGGCGGGSGQDGPKPGTRPSSPASGMSPSAPRPPDGATPTSPFRADPARVPGTARQAQSLADTVTLRPQDWGRDFVAQSTSESRPGTAAVLDERCQWQRQKLPPGVLASLSRYSELPGSAGRGTFKVTAVVTVHATEAGADDQMATTLEEVLRCPEQQVRADERITQLMSAGSPYGRRQNHYADDTLIEKGLYSSGEGTYEYRWLVHRLGTVTVAVALKGAKGYTTAEVEQFVVRAVLMLDRVQAALKGQV
ncbi:hypothetical protein [Streptomyces sp. SP18CS02]|uniref:hypothetical protein n=1 Tax=Streptomyces sp. SP18CS02 TaxID=3002531 RepID=UPI002E78909F|nr:hypothetical protein [Streptomyces sp. SP18CS02]MEE1757511.1 hypothetical protein [Streptomyces sp. SP18CS02]